MNLLPVSELPVAVIGAGPVGLAAAAHLAERKLNFMVLKRVLALRLLCNNGRM